MFFSSNIRNASSFLVYNYTYLLFILKLLWTKFAGAFVCVILSWPAEIPDEIIFTCIIPRPGCLMSLLSSLYVLRSLNISKNPYKCWFISEVILWQQHIVYLSNDKNYYFLYLTISLSIAFIYFRLRPCEIFWGQHGI